MVAYSKIVAHNEALKSTPNLVAVFVGATQGIGLGTLKAFARHTSAPTAYCVGRSPETLRRIADELKTLNPNGNYIPIECADLTLLKNVDSACQSVTQKTEAGARKVDLLCMSAGFMSFSGRHETPEGLDAQMSIAYYSRMRFAQNLLPLLREAPAGRVVSVLSGGSEGQLWADDLELKDHYSVSNVAGATGAMNTFFMEELAKKPENNKVSFVHLLPGFVGDTNIWNKTEHLNAVYRFLLGKVLTPIVAAFIGMTSEQCGERVLFAATEKSFGRGTNEEMAVGSDGSEGVGIYLVHSDSSTVTGPNVLAKMRDEGMGKKVYDHTEGEFRRVLST